MKTLAEIKQILDQFEDRYGLSLLEAVQGSDVWKKGKLGVISSSNVHRMMGKEGSETRATYMAELIGEIATGILTSIDAKQLEWGKAHEPAARAFFEFSIGEKLKRVGFVFKDNSFREGCSPDGLAETWGAQFKCPFNTANYVKFLISGVVKDEWAHQVQHEMRVLEAEEWRFSEYDPRFRRSMMKDLVIYRDDRTQKLFDQKISSFIREMDEHLGQLGFKFGEQWEPMGEVKPLVKREAPLIEAPVAANDLLAQAATQERPKDWFFRAKRTW